jgi:hypothetical protein
MATTIVICFVEVLLFSSVQCCKLLHGTEAEECRHQCELYSFVKKEVTVSNNKYLFSGLADLITIRYDLMFDGFRSPSSFSSLIDSFMYLLDIHNF